MKVTKQFEFEMAHMLAGHPSLCKNLHGHSYKLFVTVEGPIVDDMVVDFKDLKTVVKGVVVDPLDHCYAYNSNTTDEFEKAITSVVRGHGKKYYEFPFRTTCENMAKWMYEAINEELTKLNATYRVSKIRLYETSTSFADYEGE